MFKMKSNKLILKNLLITRDEFTLRVSDVKLSESKSLGIIGPNGSGKSSLLQAIAGMVPVQFGKIIINGREVGKNLYRTRSEIGYIPDDEAWLINELSADEYFSLLISIYRKAGIQVELEQNVHNFTQRLSFNQFSQPLGLLSHGNKKKVQITAALMHQPQLVIVDELRNGLDPIAIQIAEQLLHEFSTATGGCVIAATHDVWWAERFTDSVVFLGKGKIALQGETAAITKKFGSLEKAFFATMEDN